MEVLLLLEMEEEMEEKEVVVLVEEMVVEIEGEWWCMAGQWEGKGCHCSLETKIKEEE